jgi:hypothetical protein
VRQQKLASNKNSEHQDERRKGRSPLSDKMIRSVCLHFAGLDASTLRGYTFERCKTDYASATADLDIFDDAGRLVFQGREFHSGIAGYWRPSQVSMAPEWASNKQGWGASTHRPSPATVS